MDKNTLIAMAVSFLAWMAWDSYLETKYPGFKDRLTEQSAEQSEDTTVIPQAKQVDLEKKGLEQASSAATQSVQQMDNDAIERYLSHDLVLSNDHIGISFSQFDGSLEKVVLKRFHQPAPDRGVLQNIKDVFSGNRRQSSRLVTLEESTQSRQHALFFSIFDDQKPGETLYAVEKNAAKLIFKRTIKGLLIKKTYHLAAPYVLGLDIVVENQSQDAFSGKSTLFIGDKVEESSKGGLMTAGMSLGRQAVVHSLEGSEWETLSGVEDDTGREGIWSQHGLHVNWVGISSQYFLKAILPLSKRQNVTLKRVADQGVEVGVIDNIALLKAGERQHLSYKIYLGPKEIDRLESKGHALNESIDFGWFGIIAIPMLKMMKWLYSIFGNWGLAIVLLTASIKLLLLPLTWKSSISMKRMQKFQPHLKSIQERYKDDRQASSRETMRYMKENKLNPMGGCLPMLPQIPLFLALFRVLHNSIELRQAPLGLWISDLSVNDPLFVLPLLSGVLMFLQQKLMPTQSADPNQKRMFLFMNIFFTVMMLYLPAGAVLYILTNMSLSILQQAAINKYAKVD